MTRKIFRFAIICALWSGVVMAADTNAPQTPAYSIFSTSSDWDALTGFRSTEYRGKFISDRKVIGRQGLILYYLDAFPCYGLGFGVRTWLGPNESNNDAHINIVCVYPPTEIKFAWRNAGRDATQATTTGLMTCPVKADGREIIIDLGKCNQETGWVQYR